MPGVDDTILASAPTIFNLLSYTRVCSMNRFRFIPRWTLFDCLIYSMLGYVKVMI